MREAIRNTLDSPRSLLGARRRGGGGVPSLALRSIGGLTRVGAGARNVGAADGVYGPYTVASGLMSPNVTPVAPGTYDVGGVPITSEANVYDIGTGELAAVIALGSASLNGMTAKVLPNADACGGAVGSLVAIPSSVVIPAGFTLTSRDPANQGFLRRMTLAQDGPLTLRQIRPRDDFNVAVDTHNLTSLLLFGNPGTGRSGLVLDRVDIKCGDVTTLNYTVFASGTAAATAAGTVVTLSNSPDLSLVPLGRAAMIRFGTATRAIVAVDNVLKTVTMDGSLTGTNLDYAIGYQMPLLRGVMVGSGFTNFPDLTAVDTTLHDYATGIVGTFRSVDINRTGFDASYGDHTTFVYRGDEIKYDILNCTFQRVLSLNADASAPHTDSIQFILTGMVQDNPIPIRIIGNTFFGGVGSRDGLNRDQKIFLQSTPAARRVLAVIKHNAIVGGARQGLTVDRPATGTVVRSNGLFFDPDGGAPAGLTPFINLVADLPGTLVEHNVAPSIVAVANSGATVRDNYLFGPNPPENEPADYAALFAGPAASFTTSTLATAAQVLAAVTPISALITAPGRVEMGPINSYYNRATGVEDHPEDDTGWPASGLWGNRTAVAVGTPVVSDWRTVAGVSATGTAIRVSGGQAPSLSLRAADGVTIIVSGVSSVCATSGQSVQIADEASGDGLTLSTVTITAGAAASGTWTHETAAGYAPTAVVFDGTDWLYLDSGFAGGLASGAGVLAFAMYVPTAWPSAGQTILSATNAGGNAQVEVKFASTGRLTMTLRDNATVIGSWALANNELTTNAWNMLLFSWNTATPAWQIYKAVNGGAFSAVTPAAPTLTLNATTNALTRIRFGAAASTGVGAVPLSYYSDVFFAPDQWLDLSVGANREALRVTTSKGVGGITPTGTAPRLFLKGAAATWHQNKGTGTGLTKVGTLVKAPVAPI